MTDKARAKHVSISGSDFPEGWIAQENNSLKSGRLPFGVVSSAYQLPFSSTMTGEWWNGGPMVNGETRKPSVRR
jgi:hypothetical protein